VAVGLVAAGPVPVPPEPVFAPELFGAPALAFPPERAFPPEAMWPPPDAAPLLSTFAPGVLPLLGGVAVPDVAPPLGVPVPEALPEEDV
jgi:hypothetical protein